VESLSRRKDKGVRETQKGRRLLLSLKGNNNEKEGGEIELFAREDVEEDPRRRGENRGDAM